MAATGVKVNAAILKLELAQGLAATACVSVTAPVLQTDHRIQEAEVTLAIKYTTADPGLFPGEGSGGAAQGTYVKLPEVRVIGSGI